MTRIRHTASLALFACILLASARASTEPEPRVAPAAQPSAPAPASSTPNDHAAEIESAVRALVATSSLKDAQVGVAIMDVDSGHFLAVSNEHALLNPASNAKLYTAAAALAILHGDHRYETSLSGVIRGDLVEGPLVLRGFGDPSLSTEDLASMVDELRARGVHRVNGDVVIDQRFFDDQFTPPAFDQQPNEWSSFRAPVSAVALNENTVTLSVRPTKVGEPAIVTFDPPGFVDVEGMIKTTEEGADTVGLSLSPNGRRLAAKVSGAIGIGAKLVRYTRRVDDPTLLAGYALKAILERADIKVAGDVKLASNAKSPPLIVRHESAPLSQLLYSLGKASDNFYAETIFKSIAGEMKGRPAKSESSADLVLHWVDRIGAGDAGLVIKNGSGLFDANRVTTSSVALLLRNAWRDPIVGPEFVAQLSIGGVDGTLRKRFRSERRARSIRAKTGTLDDAIALSGYVSGTPGKGPIAFSVIFNHVEGKVSSARAATDAFVEKLAAYEANR